MLRAYRSAPHASLANFSPAEVILRWNLRGPHYLLKSDWEGVIESSSVLVAKYVYELQQKLAKNLVSCTAEFGMRSEGV